MGRSLRYFSQRKTPINICGNRIFMFRTKSFAEIATVFLYSRSSGSDKEKGQEKEQSSPGLLKGVMPFKDSSGHVRYFIS